MEAGVCLRPCSLAVHTTYKNCVFKATLPERRTYTVIGERVFPVRALPCRLSTVR